MSNSRPYWNMEMEPLLNTPEMGQIQLRKLREMLAKLKANAPYYTRIMEKIGFDPARLGSIEEFRETFPIYTKQKWNEIVAECGGDYLKALEETMAVSVDQLDWIATTTGTTGVPSPYPLTNRDIQSLWAEFSARGAWRCGIRSEDRILYCFALSMVIAGVPSAIAFQRIGAAMIPVGAEAKSERILRTQALFKGSVYIGTPSLAEYLIEQAPKILGRTVGELGFKVLLCGAEPGAGIPEVKARLESAYGCRIYDMGAGLGFSCDHPEYQGMHWLMDDHTYYELVDPETKKPIPFEDGATGEALFTNLETEAWTQVRSSQGDIHQVFTEPCPCGRTGFRYKVVGRADDMLKVKGIMVYPINIIGVVNEFAPRVTGAMRIVLDERPPRVVPPLKLRIEHAGGLSEAALQELEGEVVDAMSRRLKITPRILWAEPGELERSHYKGQIFEKAYEQR